MEWFPSCRCKAAGCRSPRRAKPKIGVSLTCEALWTAAACCRFHLHSLLCKNPGVWEFPIWLAFGERWRKLLFYVNETPASFPLSIVPASWGSGRKRNFGLPAKMGQGLPKAGPVEPYHDSGKRRHGENLAQWKSGRPLDEF